jgi:hypothetical protein
LGMLSSMQPQLTDQQPGSSSFAGLLSALTAAKASPENAFTGDLENDVATLSYERALQNHARYKSSEAPALPSMQHAATTPKPERTPISEKKSNHVRKCASVTIRMSQDEFAQLQRRATEANLTVSAYLRSCTFEAEALRAEVKQTLAELRNIPATPRQPESVLPKWLRAIRR